MQSVPHSKIDLSWLYTTYRSFVYSCIRKWDVSHEDGEDLTQDFFCWFISKDKLSRFSGGESEIGGFITVLLRRFLVDHWRMSAAQKRGGGVRAISLEEVPQAALVQEETPAKTMEREFAREKMDEARECLGARASQRGEGMQFKFLRIFLKPESVGHSSISIAESLGLTPGALRVRVHRLRKEFAELLVSLFGGRCQEPPGEARLYLLQLFST